MHAGWGSDLPWREKGKGLMVEVEERAWAVVRSGVLEEGQTA